MRLFAQSHWPLCLLLSALAMLAFPAAWSELLADLGGDSATYVMTARFYGSWVRPDAIAAGFARESQFPPLYPVFLAITGGAWNLALAHAATVACLMIALAALYANALALGLQRGLALVAVAVFAFMPGTVAPLLTLKSEPLYLALVLGGFAFLARAGTAAGTRCYWAAVACFSAALLTRSVGLALLPALVVCLARRRPAGWLWMVGAMLLPGLSWLALQSGRAYGSTYADYADLTLGELVGQAVFNLQAFAWGIAGNLLQTQALLPWLAVPAVLAAAVLAYRVARFEADAWYVAAYLGVMTAWPYPSEAQRFAWVIMPWVLVYALLGGHAIGSVLAGRGHGLAAIATRWAVPAMTALLVLPSFHLAAMRWFEPAERALAHLPEWYLADRAGAEFRARQHLAMVRGLAELAGQIPERDCVYSIRPAVVAVHTGRDGYLTPFERMDEAEFRRALAAPKCRYFMLLDATDGDAYRTPFYPRDRLGAALEIVEVRTSTPADGPARVVVALGRLRP